MRPIHLTISGWGPYKAECNIDFSKFDGKGLFLITGATGAGKTSVFDALCFALYGDVSGGMREKSTVRSDFAEADTATFVELTMEHGGEVYKIYRNPEYVRPKKRKGGNSEYTKERENAIIYMPDGRVIEGNQEVNRKIQDILVLNLKQFKQISMIAQGEFSRLLMAPSREKLAIFREIFGTGIYEEFENTLKQRAKALNANALALKNKLDEAVRLLALPDEELNRMTESEHLNYEKINEHLKELEKDYAQKARKLAEKYARIDKEHTILATQISKAEAHNSQLIRLCECKDKLVQLEERKKEIRDLEKVLKKAQNAAFIMPDYVKLQTLGKQLTDKEDSLKTTKQQIKELRREKSLIKKTYDMREELNDTFRIMERCDDLKNECVRQEELLTRLQTETNALREEYLLQEEECRDNNKAYEEADYAYKRATAGIVARLLEEGKPCPVCGSTHHPMPAKVAEDVPDESRLKALRRCAKESELKLQRLHSLVVEKNTQYEGEEKKYKELLDVLAKEEKDLQRNAKYLKEFDGLSVKECYAELENITGRYKILEGLLIEKERFAESLETEQAAYAFELEGVKTSFATLVKERGFTSISQFEKSSRNQEEQQNISDELRHYNEERNALKEIIKKLGNGIGKDIIDIVSLKERLCCLEKEKKDILEEQRRWTVYNDAIRRTLNSLKEKLAELMAVSEEYGYVKDLDNVANGMNPKRLVFEQYVLASYFEEILRAANLRFMKMTGGRYEMSRMETIGDGRSRDNLEIQVLDYYTGKYRHVKTLSGGETFKASLALALGMSDVIQAFHGGIRVDTLFVDEGFGTLDSESLDQACETLNALVEKDRLVGIISHVPELRERIANQIIIHKTGSGSEIQLVV